MIRALLKDLPVVAYEREDALATSVIRVALAKRGTPIGPYDVMIAGTALRRCLVMVTANVGELARIPGSIVEAWRAQP